MGSKVSIKATAVILSVIATALFSTGLSVTPVQAAVPLKIVIDLSHGQGPSTGNWTGHKLEAVTANFEGNLTSVRGYKVVWAIGGINETVLSGAQFLFLGSVYGVKIFTDAEVSAIRNWFNQGEKTIWVAADSDYGGASYIIDNANKILEALGSKIRAEPTAVQDPFANCAGAYRVRANVTNKADPDVAGIVSGVNASKGVLFHGPTILCGYVNGSYVDLETKKIKNVYWVMKTGASGTIVDSDAIMPYAHKNGQVGSFVIMAVEKYAGPMGDGKIIVTGENPYGGYQPMYTPSYYGYPLDGPTLVMNAVDWGVKVELLVDRLDAALSTQGAQIATLATQIGTLTTQLSTLQTQISTLQSQVNNLNAQIGSLQTLIYAAIAIALIGIIFGVIGIFYGMKGAKPKPSGSS